MQFAVLRRRQIAETRHRQPQSDVNYGIQKVEQDSTTGAMTTVTAVAAGDPTENKWEMLSSQHRLWSEHSRSHIITIFS